VKVKPSAGERCIWKLVQQFGRGRCFSFYGMVPHAIVYTQDQHTFCTTTSTHSLRKYLFWLLVLHFVNWTAPHHFLIPEIALDIFYFKWSALMAAYSLVASGGGSGKLSWWCS